LTLSAFICGSKAFSLFDHGLGHLRAVEDGHRARDQAHIIRTVNAYDQEGGSILDVGAEQIFIASSSSPRLK